MIIKHTDKHTHCVAQCWCVCVRYFLLLDNALFSLGRTCLADVLEGGKVVEDLVSRHEHPHLSKKPQISSTFFQMKVAQGMKGNLKYTNHKKGRLFVCSEKLLEAFCPW